MHSQSSKYHIMRPVLHNISAAKIIPAFSLFCYMVLVIYYQYRLSTTAQTMPLTRITGYRDQATTLPTTDLIAHNEEDNRLALVLFIFTLFAAPASFLLVFFILSTVSFTLFFTAVLITSDVRMRFRPILFMMLSIFEVGFI